MYRFFARLNRWSIDHPLLCVLAWLLAIGLVGSGAPRINVDASYRAFFQQDDPLLVLLNEVQAEFDSGDPLVFMISARDGDIFTRDGLTAIETVTEESWTLPESVRVDSPGNFPYSRSVDDDLYVDELIDEPASLSDAEIARIREVAMNEPLLVDRLISSDGRAALVMTVFSHRTGESLALNQEIYGQALALRDAMQARYPQLRFHVTGVVAGNAAFTDTATRDAQTLIPSALACALFAMFLFLRYASSHWGTSVRSSLAAIGVIIVSVSIPMGLMGWAGLAANNTTPAIPVIVLTLAVADSLHILLTYFDGLREDRASREALIDSLRINAEPVWLTSFTTIIGFLALNNSDSPAFRQLGNLVAIGVFTAWLASNTLLPALISLMPGQAGARRREFRAMPLLAAGLIRWHRPVLYTGVIALVGGAACIPLNVMNDAWAQYLSERTEFGHDTAEFIDIFEDLNQIEFVLDTGRENGIADPEFLDKLSRFASWAREQDGVRFVQSIDLTLRRLNRNMHGDDPAYDRMPTDAAETAQYLLLYEMSLPFGASITDELNLDKSAARVVVGLTKSDTQFHIRMQRKLQGWFAEHAPELAHPGTSTETIMANLSMRDARSMLFGTILALLAITVTLTLVFRSLRYGMLSLLVNAMPAIMTLGIWGLIEGRVGISVSMVFAASLGIVVDYSVHFISKYRRARNERQLAPEQAIHFAFGTVGVALLVTTAVLVINFGLLGVSDFKMNVYLGVLTAITIVLALLSQLFFLPSLLLRFSRDRRAVAL